MKEKETICRSFKHERNSTKLGKIDYFLMLDDKKQYKPWFTSSLSFSRGFRESAIMIFRGIRNFYVRLFISFYSTCTFIIHIILIWIRGVLTILLIFSHNISEIILVTITIHDLPNPKIFISRFDTSLFLSKISTGNSKFKN